MEEVNLYEESTWDALCGAGFEQYCTVSGLTQQNLLASNCRKGRDHGLLNPGPSTKHGLAFETAIGVFISKSLKPLQLQ